MTNKPVGNALSLAVTATLLYMSQASAQEIALAQLQPTLQNTDGEMRLSFRVTNTTEADICIFYDALRPYEALAFYSLEFAFSNYEIDPGGTRYLDGGRFPVYRLSAGKSVYSSYLFDDPIYASRRAAYVRIKIGYFGCDKAEYDFEEIDFLRRIPKSAAQISGRNLIVSNWEKIPDIE